MRVLVTCGRSANGTARGTAVGVESRAFGSKVERYLTSLVGSCKRVCGDLTVHLSRSRCGTRKILEIGIPKRYPTVRSEAAAESEDFKYVEILNCRVVVLWISYLIDPIPLGAHRQLQNVYMPIPALRGLRSLQVSRWPNGQRHRSHPKRAHFTINT